MKLSLILALLCYCSVSIAQEKTALTQQQQLIKDWQRAKTYTLQYLDVMPADHYNFRPADSIRSFAEQMLHLAQSNAGMTAIGTGAKNKALPIFFNPSFGKSASSQSKDSVTYYVSTSYDVVIDALEHFDFSKKDEMASYNLPGGTRTSTKIGWVMKAFEHQTHHRGQCTIYLRMAGIRPPAEMLWEE